MTAGADAAPAEPLLRVEGLEVHFPIRRGIVFDRTVGHVRAVDGVDLDLPRGATYGLVGESGCGKSTLGRAMLRLVEPTAGTVSSTAWTSPRSRASRCAGSAASMQMVFQDPMSCLDPRQNVESLLAEPLQGARHRRGPAATASTGCASCWTRSGCRRRAAPVSARVLRRPAAADRHRPGDRAGARPDHRRRAGVRAGRLVQAQVVNLLEELQERLGLTYLVIAHDLAVVRHISDVVGVMYLGALVEQASSRRCSTPSRCTPTRGR